MNIVADNKKIALFMGGKTSDKSMVSMGHQNIWLPVHGICRWDTIDSGRGKILAYHKSWDWLIPVIDKIKSLDTYINYLDSNVGIYINTASIDSTYNDVVNFIDWHNASKQF